MEAFLLITIMAVIGSLIGGLTNHLAITMLFKPYAPKYLFGRRLPFTPGVIPRRREEASTKLGNIIMGHLLTPEVFIEKLQSDNTKSFLTLFIDQQIETMEQEKWSVAYILERIHPTLSDKILTSLKDEMRNYVYNYGNSIYDARIDELIPGDARDNIDEYVNNAHSMIVSKALSYVTSQDGYQDIYTMIDEFIENRGRLANSIKLFFTKDSLTKRAQSEFVKLLEQPKMSGILQDFIDKEYEGLKMRQVSSFISEQDKTKVLDGIGDYLESQLDLEAKLNIPISDINPELFNAFKEKGKFRLIDNIIHYMSNNLVKILDKLELAKVIKFQIDNFELSKIEELVMEVSRKELRMITLLGFVLGGMIGVVQGILVSIL